MIKQLLSVLLLSVAVMAQSSSSGGNVTVSGSPAVNDCAKFVSATVITTAGAACGAGGGGVTSVTGTANQIDVATGTTTPVLALSSTITIPGTITSAAYATSGSNGGISAIEGTGAGLTAASGTDLLYPDSTAHRWKVNDNNGGATTLAKFTDNLSVFAATTSAQLFGVISDETGGSGVVVGSASPTIVTPTIASFTNATHDHSNAAGGGLLTGTAITASTTTGIMLPAWPTGAVAFIASLVGAQNEMDCIRFIAPNTMSIGHLSYVPNISAGSSSHVGFAIYSSDGTTRIATTGALDGTQTTKQTATMTGTINFGTAYLYCWTDDASTSTTWSASSSGVTGASWGNLINTSITNGYVKGATASVAGAPPTSLSTLTARATGNGTPFGYIEP